MVVAEIRIELKPGVADPEGKNTKKALELLGFDDIKGVRSIKMFEIEMDADPAVAHFRKAGIPASVIGEVRKGRGEPRVAYVGERR